MPVAHSGGATILLVVAINVLSGLPVFLTSALFPQIAADIPAAHGAVGIVVAGYWAAAACASNVAGWVTSRIGLRNAFLLTLGLITLSLTGSVLLSPRWEVLVVWAALGGMANGVCHPATNYLLVLRVSSRAQPVAFGIKQSAVPTATLLSGLAIPLVALTVGWQWAFISGALIAASLLVALFFTMPSSVAYARPQKKMPQKKTTDRGTGDDLSFFRTLGIATALASGAATIVTSYAVVVAPESAITPAMAGTILGIASAISVVVRISLGAVVRPIGFEPLGAVAFLLCLGTVGAIVLLGSAPAAYVCGLMLALGFGWAWPGLVHYTVAKMAGANTPKATGMVQTGTYIGCTVGPLLAGAAYAVADGRGVWILAAVLFLAAGLAANYVRRLAASSNRR